MMLTRMPHPHIPREAAAQLLRAIFASLPKEHLKALTLFYAGEACAQQCADEAGLRLEDFLLLKRNVRNRFNDAVLELWKEFPRALAAVEGVVQ